jgi:ABC-type nitrate/sulfonate/bicarbonate transport system substrate-binding protein
LSRNQHNVTSGGLGLTAALAALLGVAAFGAAQAADPVTIRLSYVVPVSDLPSLLLEKKDLAKHLDKSYRLEVTRFAGTPPMINALAAGELDIADLAYPTLPVAIQNAGLSDLQVIADGFQDGPRYSNEFMVLTDGPVKTIEDMKGKVVASNAIGSGVDIAMRAMLHKHGLQDKRDYTVIEAPFPTMRAILAEKKADLVSAVLPFALDPQLRGTARPLFTSKDAVGISEFTMWTAQGLHRQEPRRAGRLHGGRAHHSALVPRPGEPRGRRRHLRPRHQAAARAARLGVHREGLFPRPQPHARIVALQRNVDLTRDLGFIKASFDVAKQSDLSLVQEAAKRLK